MRKQALFYQHTITTRAFSTIHEQPKANQKNNYDHQGNKHEHN